VKHTVSPRNLGFVIDLSRSAHRPKQCVTASASSSPEPRAISQATENRMDRMNSSGIKPELQSGHLPDRFSAFSQHDWCMPCLQHGVCWFLIASRWDSPATTGSMQMAQCPSWTTEAWQAPISLWNAIELEFQLYSGPPHAACFLNRHPSGIMWSSILCIIWAL
jgi:hypothetical protein